MNTANALTVSRIVLIPVIMVFLLAPIPDGYLWAAGFFVLASLTDLLDGWVARKFNQISTLGIFLDPLADKLLIVATLVCLVEMQQAPAWIVVVVMARELSVTGLRAIKAESGVVIPASQWGKIKTVSQIIAIIMLLLTPLYQAYVGYNIGLWALYLAALATVLSGFEYFYRFTALSAKMERKKGAKKVKVKVVRRRFGTNPASSGE